MTEQCQGRAAAQFGLGCLHLVPREVAVHDIPVSAWLARLADVLRLIDGVTAVETWHMPLRDGDDPIFSMLAPWFHRGRAGSSRDHELGCQFRLMVDRGLLDTLGPLYRGLGRFPRVIEVRIGYVHETPIALAWTTEDHGEATGTTAFDIVRRYLALQTEDCGVMLDVLEPAPFPADLRLFVRRADADTAQMVAVDVETRPGYDLIDIAVEDYGALSDMLDHVLYQVALEAEDYYGLELAVADAERRWSEVVTRFDAFVARHRTRPAVFGGGASEIRDLMLGFVETKAAILAARHALLARVEKARASDVGMLAGYIVERFERLPEFPFDEYTHMLEFLEGRRTHRGEAVIALVSALIGGLVGSLYVLFGGG